MDSAQLASIRAAADRSEIANVLGRYCRAIDRLDVELLRSVYHPDGVDDHGAMCLNAHEFATKILDMLGSACVHTIHTVTHSVIDVEGDKAYSEAYYFASHTVAADAKAIEGFFGPKYLEEQRAAGALGRRHEYLCTGRYLDELHRRDHEWKIFRRRITLEWGVCRAEQMATEGIPAAFQVNSRRDRGDLVYQLLAGR